MTLSTQDREVLITRLFDAPRDLVFRAWTDPERLSQWFAPRGCAIEFRRLDLREGGTFLSCIHHPTYGDCWCGGEYREISIPERIVYVTYLTDSEGRPVTSEAAGKDPDWPEETVITVTFEAKGEQTQVTLHQNALESVARRTGAYPSWLEMLDRLAETL